MTDDRLVQLESKFAFQDIAIEELQKTVHDQYLMIEKLEKTVQSLADRFKTFAAGDNEIGPAGEKPPHY
ncbi:MAG: SlyX family protein [Bdellovibrionota bacterium]